MCKYTKLYLTDNDFISILINVVLFWRFYLEFQGEIVNFLDSDDKWQEESFEKAMEEYKANPVTYSLDEVEKELGL